MEAIAIFKSRYFYLLTSLIVFFIISPLLVDDILSNVILSILFSFVIIFCVNAMTLNVYAVLIISVLAAITLIGYWLVYLAIPYLHFYIYISHFIINVLFLGTITFFVLSSVTRDKHITANTLLGAICGYLLLGLTWSYVYMAMVSLNPNAFSDHVVTQTVRQQAEHFTYYSFVTLTTLGYGDITPVSSLARTFSWLEAVTGQVYLAVWISQLVGLQVAQKR